MEEYKKRRISPEFKIEAVRLMNKGDVRICEIARDMHISESTMRRWKRKVEEEGNNAFKDKDVPNKVYSVLFGSAEDALFWYHFGQSRRSLGVVIKKLELLVEADLFPDDLGLNNSANYP